MIGGTSDMVEPLLVDIASGELAPTSGQTCRYDHFMAGLLAHLDIDPGDWLPGIQPLGGFRA